MNRILSLIGVVLVVGCGSPPPVGPYEDYHDNGQLFQKGTYKDGKPDGPSEYYYDNGQLESKGTLKDNEKCGEWLEQGETVTHDPC